MAKIVVLVAGLFSRALYLLLFPPVFFATWLEVSSSQWPETAIKSTGFVLLMTIGLACAAATGGRL